jgi:hypothetical protein
MSGSMFFGKVPSFDDILEREVRGPSRPNVPGGVPPAVLQRPAFRSFRMASAYCRPVRTLAPPRSCSS